MTLHCINQQSYEDALLKNKTDGIKHKDLCADDPNINQFETERGVQWRPAGSYLCGAAALAGGLPRVRPGLHALSVEEAEAKADRDGDIRSTVSNFDALGAHGRGHQRKLLVVLQAALPHDGRRASREQQWGRPDAREQTTPQQAN